MAELTPVVEVVIGMGSKKLACFRCLKCSETHAAFGWSPGCPACHAPEAFQRRDG